MHSGIKTVANKRVEEGNGRVLSITKDYPDLIVDSLAFNKDIVARAPGAMQKIVNAVLRAIEVPGRSIQDESNRIMAPYFELDAAKSAGYTQRRAIRGSPAQQTVLRHRPEARPHFQHDAPERRISGPRRRSSRRRSRLQRLSPRGSSSKGATEGCASGWAPVLLPARASRRSSPDDRSVAQPTTLNGTESLTGWRRPAALTAPFLILLGAWYTLTGNPPLVGAEFLPNPNTVGRAFVALLTKEFFVTHLLPSVLRVSAAFAFSVAVAFPLGVLVGQVRWVALLVEPFCGFTRYLPVAALVPLCILWFGIDDGQKVAVIVLGVVFQLVLLFATDTVSVPQELLEAGRTFGLTPLQIVTRIVVPWSLPAMWNDMRIAAGWAWCVPRARRTRRRQQRTRVFRRPIAAFPADRTCVRRHTLHRHPGVDHGLRLPCKRAKTVPMAVGAPDVLIEFDGVAKTFSSSRTRQVPAIKDVSFRLHRGEFLCVVGPSGCGKSTIIRLAAGLETATSGSVFTRANR